MAHRVADLDSQEPGVTGLGQRAAHADWESRELIPQRRGLPAPPNPGLAGVGLWTPSVSLPGPSASKPACSTTCPSLLWRSASRCVRTGVPAPGCGSTQRGPSECLKNNNKMKTLGFRGPEQLHTFFFFLKLTKPPKSLLLPPSFHFCTPPPKNQDIPKINSLDNEWGFQEVCLPAPLTAQTTSTPGDHSRERRQLHGRISCR